MSVVYLISVCVCCLAFLKIELLEKIPPFFSFMFENTVQSSFAYCFLQFMKLKIPTISPAKINSRPKGSVLFFLFCASLV